MKYGVWYAEENMSSLIASFLTEEDANAFCESKGWKHGGYTLYVVQMEPLPACCFN